MRVLVATDAWTPQVNGVVRTYERLALEAPALGFDVSFLAPPLFRSVASVAVLTVARSPAPPPGSQPRGPRPWTTPRR
jgi:hypothetical protein